MLALGVLKDLLVPHPIKGIVKVVWLDPYASCLLFSLGFDLSAIKLVIITDNVDQVSSPWWEGWESCEPRGVVWDIQIVFNAFIVMMLELGVDRAIRCDAGRGA